MLDKVLDLFPAQGRAYHATARELLVEAEPVAGASHLLHVLAVLRAASTERANVVLACASPRAVREDHLEGPGGLWELLELARDRGLVQFTAGGLIRFLHPGGQVSTLRLTTWDAAARYFPDFLFIDDGDEMPWPAFADLRERVLAKGPATVPRLTVVSKKPGGGWPAEHWNSLNGGGARVVLPAGEVPEEMRTAARARKAGILTPEDFKPGSFREHAERALPSLIWYRHVEAMAAAIEQLFAGTLPEECRDRVFIAAPPQAGKSTMTRLAGSRWLRTNPHLVAGLASYNQRYARKNSRKIRDYYRASGGKLRRDAFEVDSWELPEGGGLWVTGIGGGTGNPANLLISDDLVKGAKEAGSEVRQEDAIEWRDSSWKSRWNPYGGRLIELMIGTRWDLSDVQSSALEEGGWYCVILPGLMPEQPIEVPEGNVLAPDWREPGEALCEELPKLNRKDLLEMRDGRGPKRKGAMKPRRFAALIQQQPKPDAGGGIFKKHWFQVLAVDPQKIPDTATGKTPGDSFWAAQARAWDFAGTKGGGDATTSTRTGRRSDNGRVVIRDTTSVRESPEGVKTLVGKQMLLDGPLVTIGIPIDPGQAGKFQIAEYTTWLREYAAKNHVVCPPIRGMVTSGSKVSRAQPYADAAEPVLDTPGQFIPGNVDIVAGLLTEDFLEQHHDFTGEEGKPDDFVDSAGDSYRLVSEIRAHLGWRRKR